MFNSAIIYNNNLSKRTGGKASSNVIDARDPTRTIDVRMYTYVYVCVRRQLPARLKDYALDMPVDEMLLLAGGHLGKLSSWQVLE